MGTACSDVTSSHEMRVGHVTSGFRVFFRRISGSLGENLGEAYPGKDGCYPALFTNQFGTYAVIFLDILFWACPK